MDVDRLRAGRRTFVFAALLIVLAGCSAVPSAGSSAPPPSSAPSAPSTATAAATGNVSGIATAGPVCPVSRPGDPSCLSRAVAGATLVVTTVGGSEVARTTTAADGRFAISLPAGDYLLAPQPFKGLIGPAPIVPFSVGPDGTSTPTPILVEYDTGIR